MLAFYFQYVWYFYKSLARGGQVIGAARRSFARELLLCVLQYTTYSYINVMICLTLN